MRNSKFSYAELVDLFYSCAWSYNFSSMFGYGNVCVIEIKYNIKQIVN